jgi:hypothetical protein
MTNETPVTPKPRGRKPRMAGAEAGSTPEVVTTITTTTVEDKPAEVPPVPAGEPDVVAEINTEDVDLRFDDLGVDELKNIALYFAKDVDAADVAKGPSRLELVAALASDSDSEPVTWDDYQNLYLPAQAPKVAPAESRAAGKLDAEYRKTVDELEDEDKTDWPLVKMERKNPRYDLLDYTFTHEHPFHQVPPAIAERMVREHKGFRLALPSEVRDYYN